MRKVYWIVLVVLGLVVVQAGKIAMRPYPGQEAGAIFVMAACAFVGLLVFLLITGAKTRVRDTYPFRITRLWFKAKEQELERRANSASSSERQTPN